MSGWQDIVVKALSRAKWGLGALVLAAPLIHYFEGYKPKAYVDPVGIVTICSGITKINGHPIKLGTVLTDAQCRDLEEKEMRISLNYVERYIHTPMTEATKAAFVSFTYNLGPGPIINQNIGRLANAGYMAAACERMNKYVCGAVKPGTGETNPAKLCYSNKHNLKVLPGLVTRRQAESDLCIKGLR